MSRFGYNTNGFAHHRLSDCFEILSELGYSGVAITVDVQHLNPEETSATQIREYRTQLRALHLEPSIETGARYLLDPRHKHQPTLLSREKAQRDMRIDFLKDCISIGSDLEAKVVSFWSGKLPEGVNAAEARKHLEEGCAKLLEFARLNEMTLAFEPEPGMLIEDISQFREFRKSVGTELKLALDVGHCYCTKDLPIQKIVEEFRDSIATAALEDIRGGKHEHLMLGEGEIDFAEVLRAFRSIDYSGLISLELSRDSHRAPECASRAIRLLQDLEAKG